MKTASRFLVYVSIWFSIGWLGGWLQTQIKHNSNFMNTLNYFISESYFFYPMLGLYGVVIIIIFSQIKLKKRMNAIVELKSKIADENVTAEQATVLVAQEVTAQIQPILDMITQNATEDGLTRDQVNAITEKFNETLNIIGSDAPVVAPVDETPIPDPVDETPIPDPVDETPIPDPVDETPIPEEPAVDPVQEPGTDVPPTDPVN